jgi:hypothetical protein
MLVLCLYGFVLKFMSESITLSYATHTNSSDNIYNSTICVYVCVCVYVCTYRVA